MDLKANFFVHVEKAKELPESIPKKDKDVLYGLKMQSIHGPVTTVRPGMYNMKDPHEWDAWHAVKDKTKEEAMTEYTKKVQELHSNAL